jgi:hypothetical protein
MTWDIGESLPQSSSSAWNIAPVCFVDQSLAPWEGGGGGWGRDNGRQGNSPPFGSGGGGGGGGSGASGSGNLKGSRVNNLNSGIGHNNNNKPHLSSSNNNNNNREGGASLESLVHAARGVVVEGEKGTILTTISNDRLMLASLSAAVE